MTSIFRRKKPNISTVITWCFKWLTWDYQKLVRLRGANFGPHQWISKRSTNPQVCIQRLVDFHHERLVTCNLGLIPLGIPTDQPSGWFSWDPKLRGCGSPSKWPNKLMAYFVKGAHSITTYIHWEPILRPQKLGKKSGKKNDRWWDRKSYLDVAGS